VRYIRRRHWLDLFLLLSVPLLMMPSILSLAFPDENPALNRAGGAIVVVFLISALAMEGFLEGIKSRLGKEWGPPLASALALLLLIWSGASNYNLVFNRYYREYEVSSWNTSEMGAVIGDFANTVGDRDSAWVLAFPHWVDNRLVGISAGFPTKNYALGPEELEQSLEVPPPKMFLVKPEDEEGLEALMELYPNGANSLYESAFENKDFYIFFVPAEDSN
jgi:hypothetical protein